MESNSSPWSVDDIPSQKGKNILITGANAGLGLASARILAGKGAHVIMACRYMPKAEEARDLILAETPDASLDLIHLDLADLDSVSTFAAEVNKKYAQLHVLLNNAGLNSFGRHESAQGFEQTFAVNHLGHFALTAQLFDLLKKTPASRVVTLSSSGHRSGKIDFDDLMTHQGYRMMKAYGQSKLANLLFAKQLQRNIVRDKLDMLSVAIHPGFVSTNMVNRFGDKSIIARGISKIIGALILSPADGARPQLYAATADGIEGGNYYVQGKAGRPAQETPTRDARNQTLAERLWKVSEELTGLNFPSSTKA
jgi:NAD(P)-dependent dehydrogenase (short-subunit alcohol dehydrogenase family)